MQVEVDTLGGKIALEYDTFGDTADPAIVLIRGLGTQMVEWHPNLIDELVALKLQVVIFDNRDVGLSQKLDHLGVPGFREVMEGTVAAPYRLSDMAQDVVGLMDALHMERAHILGISLGGMVAQVLTAEHPNRVMSLLSVMSSSGRPGLPGPSEAATKAFSATPPETQAAIIEQSAEHKAVFGSPGYPEPLAERLESARRSVERCYHPDGVARQRLAIASQMDRTEMLSTIAVPTTVIHGDDDPLIPVECGRDTATAIPGARFVGIPGMGHNIPKLLVPEFVQQVKQHLEGLS